MRISRTSAEPARRAPRKTARKAAAQTTGGGTGDGPRDLVPDTTADAATASTSDATPVATLGAAPGATPDAASDAASDAEPVAISDAAPAATSDAEPVVTSDAAPIAISDAAPAATSGATPDATSDAAPVVTSGAVPAATSDAAPIATSPAIANAAPAATSETARVATSVAVAPAATPDAAPVPAVSAVQVPAAAAAIVPQAAPTEALQAASVGEKEASESPRRPAGPGRGLLARIALAPVHLAGRHLWITVAAGAAAFTALLSWLLGPGLSQHLEAQGMDDERAYLLSAMVLVILATAVVGAASRRPAPTRLGGVAGFVGIQIVPFLLRAATQPNIGLKYQQNIIGWILQPLGMLLLAVISVIVGAALGMGLAHDASRLPSFFRQRRTWPAIPVAIALIVLSLGAAVTALQDGPLSALRNYAPRSPQTAFVPATPSPTASGSGVSSVAAATPTPNVPLYRQIPGSVQYLTIANRQVDVYVPGMSWADSSLPLPVLYLLHGTPGQQGDWLNGGQLQPVLDQLISKGTLPPLFVVLPNGNTAQSTDTEWGDSSAGQIESWIVNQVVPAIDSRYHTLGAGYRGIAGLSSGGYGAVNIAFQNPNVFGWAGSYSGYFVGRSATFGTAWRANSPLYTASTVPVGDRIPIYLGAGSTDYLFKPDTTQFAAALKALGWLDVDVQTVSGGHGWVAWQAEMVQSLTSLGQLWGPEPWAEPLGPPSVAAARDGSSVGAL
jgi:enterochelin esterase-like enzyme